MTKTNETADQRLNGHALNGTVPKEASPKKKKKGRRERREPQMTTETTAADESTPSIDEAKVDADVEAAFKAASIPPEETSSTEPSSEGPSPIEEPAVPFRMRMKVWTDTTTNKRYLTPSAFMRDVVNDEPVTDIMYAYAMSDGDTKVITLTVTEWNALPFYYFQEDGEAPRASARPVDKIDLEESPKAS